MIKFILLSCIFLASIFLNAQESSSETKSYTKESNFFKAKRKAEHHFKKSLDEIKKSTLNEKEKNKAAEELEEYAEYKRWENFWRDRVLSSGKYPSPSFLYNEFLKSKPSSNRTSNTISNWNCISQTHSTGGYNGMGRTTCTAFHPTDPHIFYVGSPNGGLWKTTDAGLNYTPLGDQLPFVSAGAILVDPVNPDILYVSTGDAIGWWNYNTGIYKSIDGGATWNPTGVNWLLSSQHAIYNIAFQPGNSAVIYVASTDGLFRSNDSGVTFLSIKSGSINDIEFKPGSSTSMYCCKDDYWGSSEVYFSNDAGDHWNLLSSFNTPHNFLKLAVTPANPDVLGVYSSNNDEVYVSTDSGVTLNLRSSGAPGNGAFFIAPQNADIIFCGGVNVSRSIDGGVSWITLTSWYSQPSFPTVHADLHNINFNPLNTNELFFNNDGGLYRYRQNLNAWSELSNNLVITQFYSLANSVTDPNFIIGGSQDNGGRKKTGPASWASTNGGDAMVTAVDPSNDQIMYTTYTNGTLYRSMDRWTQDTYHEITPHDNNGVLLTGDWTAPYLLNPQNPSTIYAAYSDVYWSPDRGDNWTALSSNLTGSSTDYLQELAAAPSDSLVIYTSRDNILFKTFNHGVSWTSTTLSGSERITSILVHPSDPNTIWISRGGFTNRVLKSTNGGASFSDVSGSLPYVPANCLFYEPGSQNGIYVGTDLGVFYINDLLPDWVSFNDGLPAVQITDFAFYPPAGKLRISTYGRGIWENDLYSVANAIPKLQAGQSLSLFPNPSDEFTTITFPAMLKGQKAALTIYDIEGRKIYQDDFINTAEKIIVNTSNFSNGIYISNFLCSNSEPVSIKFIVQHF